MQKPKGTTDFYPEELAVRNRIFIKLRETALRYNFLEIESPAFESMDLLSRKEGEEIREQIFTLEKKGNEHLGLRFDLTVPAVRMFIQAEKGIPKPVKWFYLSRMWRYEQPQQGRLREFYQFSAELFGSRNADADAEIISLAIESLLSLGLKKGEFIVRLNNKKLLEGILEEFIPEHLIQEVIKLIDKSRKIDERVFNEEMTRMGINKDMSERLEKAIGIKNLSDISESNIKIKEGISELKSLLSSLGTKSEFITLDISTARGLSYYTGNVFEIFDSHEKYRSIAGGGRYDNLVELLGGRSTPAIGFAIGYAVLELILKDKGLISKTPISPEYFIAIVSDDLKEKAIEITDILRKRYTVEIELGGRNLNNQLKYANSIKAKKVIILGKKELVEGMVVVKDMSNGSEQKIKIVELLEYLKPHKSLAI